MYTAENKRAFKEFAHTHTKVETEKWLENHSFNLDIMYNENGKPDCYDDFREECAGIRCKDGYLWN